MDADDTAVQTAVPPLDTLMTGTALFADRFARAVVYACSLHAGAKRDDNKTPYAVHPMRVAEYLRIIANEKDENVILAAVLHDTIEDCAITYDNVADQFGDDVATLVAELTNDNRLPKNKRKEAMIAHLPELSARAKRIKLADRLDNVLDLVRGMGTAGKRNRYIGETEKLLDACRGACEPLERALADALEELRQQQKWVASKP